MSHSMGDSDYHGSSSLASSFYSDSPALTSAFGSPNYITGDGEPSTPRDRRLPSQASLPIQTRHPLLGRRSFSYGASDRTSTTNSAPHAPASPRRSTAPLPPHPRQWSLFGQLMENGTLFRSSVPVPPGPRRTSSDQPSRLSQVPSVDQLLVGEPLSDVFSTRLPPHPHARSAQEVSSDQLSGTEEDRSSQGSEETATATTRAPRTAIAHWIPLRVPTIPLLWKNMLKCSVAYFIASLFTFHPSLSRFFGDLTSYGSAGDGPYPSAHLIATM